MLRVFDESGGIGVYARNLVPELLKIDPITEYVLIYNNPKHIGTFSMHQNVKEITLKGKNKVFWDQIAVPLVCYREKIDLIFHPKFTVPFFAPCKAIMVVHGADWFMPDQAIYYPKTDIAYIKAIMPLYMRKASSVISVSQLTTDNFYSVLKLPAGKIRTIYFAPSRVFHPIKDKGILSEVKNKYHLPEKFILTLTKRKGDKRKNLGQIFQAYEKYNAAGQNPHKLVVGGKDCHLFRDTYQIPEDGYGKDIIFPGWIDQADLPAVYSLADVFLYPSNLEAFPIPITEAMACGTPIITSDANGLREIAGDAAVFVDPQDTQAIRDSLLNLLEDRELRATLSQRGLDRSTLFTWDSCAKQTLALMKEVAAKHA